MRLISVTTGLALLLLLAGLFFFTRSASVEGRVFFPFPDSTLAHAKRFTAEEVQKRIDARIEKGEPIVVHITVALCDNVNQGIVPVPEKIGNGQDPTNNLYWGAAYGVRTYMSRTARYGIIKRDTLPDQGILERIVFHKKISRKGKNADLYLIADAWDGSKIDKAIWRFLAHAGGYLPEEFEVPIAGRKDTVRTITGGGASVLAAFVGHNGLMDFRFEEVPTANPAGPARASLVLACASRPYFLDILNRGGSHPLLLTTNLMAPEAYSLEAAISAFTKGESPKTLHENVAAAYHKYQKCGMKGARRLFAVEE